MHNSVLYKVHMASACPRPKGGGKLFREMREACFHHCGCQRLKHLTIQHADFDGQALPVNETYLRKNCGSIASRYLAHREIILSLLFPRGKRYHKTNVQIELCKNNDRPCKQLPTSVLFIAHVCAKRAPPNFTFVEQSRAFRIVEFLFLVVPRPKILFHSRYCSITKSTQENA